MFRPTMKQRHLDAIVRMAAESGRDPQEVYAELLDHATSSDPPPNVGQGKAPPTPPAAGAAQSKDVSIPRPGGGRIAKVVVVPPPEGPLMGETLAQARRREAGDDPEATEPDEEDATGDAPPEQMKGNAPNPLSLIKQWAGKKDDSIPTASPEAEKQDERARLRQKYLVPRGRPQQRG